MIRYYVAPQGTNIWREVLFSEYIKHEAEGGWDFAIVSPPGVLPQKNASDSWAEEASK